jgi:enoyl-CoA hydratase
MTEQPEILCEARGAAGLVLLNRPHALNALTHGMVRTLAAALDDWERDPRITRIVIRGAGGRAFCAGGDIRAIYELCRAGRQDEALAFWRDEYTLNARIQAYPKPYVALIDGIVMGGGVGVSLHGSHRVAGERYAFAMPEVGIGFFPDVGATWALPRLPGHAGTWLALTGSRIGDGDALALGLATHAAAAADFPAIEDALAEGMPVDEAIARHARPAPASTLPDRRALIDECFGKGRVQAILDALDQAAPRSDFARDMAAVMRSKSPTSLAIAFEQMRRGATMSFEEAMRTEFRIVSRIIHGHEFQEGVRAAIIDKDQSPAWRPASLGEVGMGDVEAYFAPLPPGQREWSPA